MAPFLGKQTHSPFTFTHIVWFSIYLNCRLSDEKEKKLHQFIRHSRCQFHVFCVCVWAYCVLCIHHRVEYCRLRLFCYFRLLWRFIYLFSLFPFWLLVGRDVFALTPFFGTHFWSPLHRLNILTCFTFYPIRQHFILLTHFEQLLHLIFSFGSL